MALGAVALADMASCLDDATLRMAWRHFNDWYKFETGYQGHVTRLTIRDGHRHGVVRLYPAFRFGESPETAYERALRCESVQWLLGVSDGVASLWIPRWRQSWLIYPVWLRVDFP